MALAARALASQAEVAVTPNESKIASRQRASELPEAPSMVEIAPCPDVFVDTFHVGLIFLDGALRRALKEILPRDFLARSFACCRFLVRERCGVLPPLL